MKIFHLNKLSLGKQYMFSATLVLLASTLCFAFSDYLSHREVALILLLVVSIIAISFDIMPVLLSAVLSACIWDFFFIPPRFTLHVETTEDLIFLIMYFIIAMVNAVLTHRIRKAEKLAREREEKSNTINLYNTLLSSLSHELRTPIATIIAATDNLQAGNVNLREESRVDLVNEISKASLRLNQQVENLLNMSRIESGMIQPKSDWCDIRELTYDVVKRIEELNAGRKIKVAIEDNLPLYKSAEVLLDQVLYNLLHNACMYTPLESLIQIRITSAPGAFNITVEDDGAGFPADELPKVFDKFYRLKNTQVNGTGLGLSIVKGFVEAIGGTIDLKNKTEGGAKFLLCIQAASHTQVLKNE